ncbi:four helix bundle protein [Candidatus Amesbacteria bacterium]|nr:four helix bundle protein [Candidatus Amesbacteria bacterium]
MNDRYTNLEVWKKAHEYTLFVYKLTKKFPHEEKYSLCDQLKRSTSSIPTNVVEGNERQSKKEFIQLLLARDLGYITDAEYQKAMLMANEIGKMINELISYLKSSKI